MAKSDWEVVKDSKKKPAAKGSPEVKKVNVLKTNNTGAGDNQKSKATATKKVHIQNMISRS